MTARQRARKREHLKRNRAWVKALRSGRYTKCKGHLHELGDGHCCLGVACEVHSEATRGKGFSWTSSSARRASPFDYVTKWFGWEYRNPYLGEDSAQSLNDGHYEGNSHGKPFAQIANLIERHIIRPIEKELKA